MKSKVLILSILFVSVLIALILGMTLNQTIKQASIKDKYGAVITHQPDAALEASYRRTIFEQNSGLISHDYFVWLNKKQKAEIKNIVPRLIVTPVDGNTIKVGWHAKFLIRLASKPKDDVTVKIESSNESEGITSIESFTFTEYNWNSVNYVYVIGTNPKVIDGYQNYVVTLSDITSEDPDYDGLVDTVIKMRGLDFSLKKDVGFFRANFETSYDPIILHYARSNATHWLLSAPEGMVVDEKTGVLTWAPPTSASGKAFKVELVSVVDGIKFNNTVNAIVLPATVMEGTINNKSLLVSDSQSRFDKYIFSYGDDSTESASVPLEIKEVPISELPPLPVDWSVITDGFYWDLNEAITIHIPRDIFNRFSNKTCINYYKYVSTRLGHKWASSRYDLSSTTIGEKEYLTFTVSNTQELGVIGYCR